MGNKKNQEDIREEQAQPRPGSEKDMKPQPVFDYPNVKGSGKLEGKVAFSEINLSIYQKEMMKRVMLANEKNIKEYEPNMMRKFVDSVAFGWDALNELFFFLLRFWFLILTGAAAYVLYKKYGRK